MGKKLGTLLGRTFHSKFKALVNLAISRLAVLKNHRKVRCFHARSDVLQLLNLGQQKLALSRVEFVIKEQNLLDVFVMVEGYCHFLMEKVCLIENNNRECPDELKEGVTSLLFAASRYWEFPELQEIRGVFTSRFGKEFAASAVDLPNTCGVNPKMIQKLSTRRPSLESRLEVLDEIASENGIALYLKDASSLITKEKQDSQPEPSAELDNAKFKQYKHSLSYISDDD
ncbi:hypothetical protein HHK36_029806 [Tetracentron sinense]|uniref:IST1-like protein n=1 Tax=Tetracentron sinense TaxID=13715 RepID=A0A834YEK9_TETSI|nr:hypothetical protein HHK36_029806 [Tetracentron sinense]